MPENGFGLRQDPRLSQTLAPQMRAALRYLQMPAISLAREIRQEIDRNPVLENVSDGTPVLSDVEHEEEHRDGKGAEDLPEDDFVPGTNPDEESLERRQRLFDLQVRQETLQDHLLAQVSLSDIPTEDRDLAVTLIGQIDDNGRFVGSTADIQMVTGASPLRINAVLRRILKFDPTGCGARDLRECLLAQLDKLDGDPCQGLVRKLVAHHLEDLAAGRLAEIAAGLKATVEDVSAALKVLGTLDPKPGRGFVRETLRPEYVSPEIHAVRQDGKWVAVVDERGLPEIRISPKYRRMLEEGRESAETLAFVRERIRAAEEFRQAIIHRQDTIRAIAQTVFDEQQAFFENGRTALRPLTMETVAKRVGVDTSTVSRTVNGKYAETPQGTVEMRQFFVSGIGTQSGEAVSTETVKRRLAEIVAAEDPAHPLADEALTAALVREGFDIKRRTVAKYRGALGIPGTSQRRKKT